MRIRFAQFLASRGYLSGDEALALASEFPSIREVIGAIALSHNLITLEQLDHILSQLSGERRFGEVALELGYLTRSQLTALLEIQEVQEALEFGELLVVRGVLKRAELTTELARFFAQVDATGGKDLMLMPSRADPSLN